MSLINTTRKRLGEDRRFARVLRGGLTGLMGRGAALLVSALTLPLTVRYLGPLQYGVWVTISTSVVMLAVLDLGIANSLTNLISKSFSDDDEVLAQKYFATAFWLTMMAVCLMGVIAFFSWQAVNWGSVFHLSDPTIIARSRACAGISICFFLLGLPLGLANRVLAGYQKIHISNYFAMLNSVLGLVAIVTAIKMHGSIVTLMAVFCTAMLTGSILLNLWLFFWHRPLLRPLPTRVERGLIRGLLGNGFLFFLLQLSTLVVFNSDNLVISHFLGAAEVTPYSVAWRLTNYATMMQSLLVPSLWPAFAEAYHRRDMQWIRDTYRRTTRGSVLAVGSVALFFAVFGRTIIRIWAGPPAVPSLTLLWCMAGWAVIVSITTNQALLLTATDRLKLEATVAIVAAVANLYLSIRLVTYLGSVGVILSTIVSFILFMMGPQEWEVRKVLAGMYIGRD